MQIIVYKIIIIRKLMNKNMRDVKIDIIKKAILLGWVVTKYENDTIVIKKNKINMSKFEKNTELLLKFLMENDNLETSIQKIYSVNKNDILVNI
jgi:hypothetical protein